MYIIFFLKRIRLLGRNVNRDHQEGFEVESERSRFAFSCDRSVSAQKILSVNEFSFFRPEEDTILVCKRNPDWSFGDAQATEIRSAQILDFIATWQMPYGKNIFSTNANFTTNQFSGERRDSSAPHFLFHFKESGEVPRLKRDLQNMFKESIGMTDFSREELLAANVVFRDRKPFADCYLVFKITPTSSDVIELEVFYA